MTKNVNIPLFLINLHFLLTVPLVGFDYSIWLSIHSRKYPKRKIEGGQSLAREVVFCS